MEGGPVRSFCCHCFSTAQFRIQTEVTSGMIPRAVEEVFKVAKELENKGWTYKMEGQFLEIVSSVSIQLHDGTDAGSV